MRIRLALCVVAVLSLAACGGGGSSKLTVSTYRAKANAICAHFYATKIPASASVTARYAAALRSARKALAGLRSLSPPAQFAALHARLVRVDTQTVDLFARLLKRLKAGTITQAQVAKQFDASPLGGQEAALWKKVGASVCARGPTS